MDSWREILMLAALVELIVIFGLGVALWSRPVKYNDQEGDMVYHPGTGTILAAQECVLVWEEDITPDYGHDPADGAWF